MFSYAFARLVIPYPPGEVSKHEISKKVFLLAMKPLLPAIRGLLLLFSGNLVWISSGYVLYNPKRMILIPSLRKKSCPG